MAKTLIMIFYCRNNRIFQNWLRDTTLPLRISIKLIPIKASYLKRCFSKSNKHVVQLNVRFATSYKKIYVVFVSDAMKLNLKLIIILQQYIDEYF